MSTSTEVNESRERQRHQAEMAQLRTFEAERSRRIKNAEHAARPGVQTSEFRMAALSGVIGVALIALGLWKDNETLVIAGTAAAVGAAGAYGVGRSIAKNGALKLILLAWSVIVIGGGIGGCVGPSARTPTLSAQSTTKNLATNDGKSWETVQAQSATNIDASAAGLMQQSGGPHRTLTLAVGEAVFTITDPLDGSLEGFRAVMPDGTSIELDGFESRPSVTIAAADRQVLAHLEAEALITAQQAAVVREALEAGKSLSEGLIRAVLVPGS